MFKNTEVLNVFIDDNIVGRLTIIREKNLLHLNTTTTL